MNPLSRPGPTFTLLASALLAALLSLAGCGPGTGGTGTGEGLPALASFGAVSASLCNSPLAANLSCKSVGTPALPVSEVEGTQVVNYADTALGGNISIAIQVNSIVLDSRCAGLHFSGDWGIAASNDARFFGSYTVGTSTLAMPATLTLVAVGSGKSADMLVTVRTANGSIVVGPVTLQIVTAPVASPVVCK